MRRRPSGALALAAALPPVLVLSGCTAELDGAASLSAWTAAAGARWDAFVEQVLVPLGDALLAMLVAWLVLAVAARLVTLLPGVRNLKLTRRAGGVLRVVGWTLVVLAPIVIVAITVYASDGFAAWLYIAVPLALVSSAVLGPGLASRSRLDAKVMASDGSTNTAWSIDALMQVRNANLDDPAARVERPSTPDLGEFIAIADRSGSGIASAVAWLFQVLFNSAPWMLQVTIVDQRSAIATLRRNGHQIDEVELALEWETPEPDQHRKLLALAAAFTAMKMAERYPDVRGFYRASSWKSVGYLGLARMTRGEERRHYLNRAIDEEPTSLLAEYDRVFDRLDSLAGREAQEAFLDRVEPIVNQAAWLCGEPPVFDDVRPKAWHSFVRTAVERGGPHRDPSDVRAPMRPVHARLEARRAAKPPEREPKAMLLRSLMAYLTAARNWAAYVELDETAAGDPAVAARRERIRAVVDRYIELLERETGGPRSDPNRVLARMRARAALSYGIFTPGAAEAWAGASPGEAAATAQFAAAQRWMADAGASLETEIRYSYACFTARRALAAASPEEHAALVDEALRGIRFAKHADYYQREAARDPELMLLGREPRMRELVLAPIASPWQIARFAAVRGPLQRRGILEPERIADEAAALGLGDTLGLGDEEFALLVDAAAILRVGMSAEEGGLSEPERLRAVRYLVDDAGYSVRALASTFAEQFDALVAAVARAVYWVPTREELEDVARYLVGLITHLDTGAVGPPAERSLIG